MGASAAEETPIARLLGSRRFQNWLKARVPSGSSVTLDRRQIYILPTREGLVFAFMLLIMMIAAINYQNSLIFAFTFLLGSLYVVSILHTYRNMAGLTFTAGASRNAFAGEDAEFNVIVSRLGDRTYEAVQVGWSEDLMQTVDLVDVEEAKLRLYVRTVRRGRLKPGRLGVHTFYPVGLFRAWTWVQLDMSTVVYPKPILVSRIPSSLQSGADGELIQREGVDDFYALREYQVGDPLRHVAWKSYARTNEMLIKQYAAFVDRQVWLDWDFFPGMDRESRLSRLCYLTLILADSTDEYGLRLPGIEIAPATGQEHKDEVLETLALFELDDRDG